ncbi:MAG: ATP-grasp domain-containing protein [Eubacteriales bacterium]|nr:ATP-grasp domain-containing protein [Eubacteriales bacterium]
MKKIMILGASYSLLPLIDAAKRLGYSTVVTSIPGNYPGFSVADEVCYADITNPAEVLEAARKHQVSGIATCSMDVGLRSQGYTATQMGLCGPSWEAVQKCTNKYEMKKAFVKAGVNTAAFVQVRSLEELKEVLEKMCFPVMIKAVDQMGSRGIFRCDTREDALRFYPQTMVATKQDYCIVEEFLEGTIFGVEAMVENGRLVYVLPVSTLLHEGNPPFPMGHAVPWVKGQPFAEKVRKQVELAVQALGTDNCPMNFDMMLKDGEIYIIEGTARAGATGLSQQVGMYFGVNYYEMIVRLSMGEEVSSYFQQPPRVCSEVRLLEAKKEGIVEEIIPGTAVGENLVDLSFNIAPGDTVCPMTNGRDRIGQVIVKGNSPENCGRFLKEVLERIEVKTKDEQ